MINFILPRRPGFPAVQSQYLRNIDESRSLPQRRLPVRPELLPARPSVSHFADVGIEDGLCIYHQVERRHAAEELIHRRGYDAAGKRDALHLGRRARLRAGTKC